MHIPPLSPALQRIRYRTDLYSLAELDWLEKVGKMIELRLKLRRDSMKAVAEKAGIGYGTLQQMVHGKPVRVALPNLKLLAEVLDIDISLFFKPQEHLFTDYAHVPHKA